MLNLAIYKIMCTVNSLAKAFIGQNPFLSRGITILFFVVCIAVSNGNSRAHTHSYCAPNAIGVQAPADMRITIINPLRCDTVILLPPALCISGCTGVLTYSTSSVFSTIPTNGGLMSFPTGSFDIVYTISNDAGMIGRDTMRLTVFDTTRPNTICKSEIGVFLNNTGYAELPAYYFDAGSSDNCGHLFYKVKRMFVPIGYSCTPADNPDYLFDDEVSFCCMDLDSFEIMIRLRVYDAFPGYGPVNDTILQGHFAECMIRVQISDKLPPELNCPNNVTISCGQDIDSVLQIHGLTVLDNCSLVEVDTITKYSLTPCGSGFVERTFVATDENGLSSSCTQIITVNKANNFNGLDTNQLKWPGHKLIFACRIQVDTIQSGAPIIIEDECENVQASFKDEVYNFNRGGVCAKILRFWEVIDWCQYDPRIPNPKQPSNGYYSYTQEIKVMDTVAPVITGLHDTTVYLLTENCSPGFVGLPTVHATDCGSSINIAFRYEIDFYNDGIVDSSLVGDNASGIFPIGNHRICFIASDSCHNEGKLCINLIVRDGKAPDAKAMYGLSTNVSQMPAGIMISISARFFDQGSSDNCTSSGNLRFSFSGNINDTIRTFNCDSIGHRIISFVVWDESGNSAQVYTYIVITDANHLCPTSVQTLKVEGIVSSPTGLPVPEADIEISYNQITNKEKTDHSGAYAFQIIPMYSTVSVKPTIQSDYLLGLTTADIVAIQKHILNSQLIENPYKLLAADLDQNARITTNDISVLRSLLLGKTNTLPGGKSFVFIDKTYQFTNSIDPFDECKTKEINLLPTISENKKLDLYAIKLGDVNQSIRFSGITEIPKKSIAFEYFVKDHYLIIQSLSEGTFTSLQCGFQFTNFCNQFTTTLESELSNFNSSHYVLDPFYCKFSYSQPTEFKLKKGTILAKIKLLKNDCNVFLGPIPNFEMEMIDVDNHVYTIRLIPQIMYRPGQILFRAFPNPIKELLNIVLENGGINGTTLTIYSIDHKLIYNKIYNDAERGNQIVIPKHVFPIPGIYMVQLKQLKDVVTFKIIVE